MQGIDHRLLYLRMFVVFFLQKCQMVKLQFQKKSLIVCTDWGMA